MLYQGSNPGIIPERSVKSPLQSCSFHHSEFKIPSSNVHFVQGIPTNFPSTSCLRQLKYDRESVASANTDNIDNSESKFGSWPFLSANNLLALFGFSAAHAQAPKKNVFEGEMDIQEGEIVDCFGKDICNLFQAENGFSCSRVGDASIHPLNKDEIPRNLLSIVEIVTLPLGDNKVGCKKR